MQVSSNAVSRSPLRSVGESNLKQNNALRQLRDNYVQHGNPRSFYLTIDVRDGPSVVWSLNTKMQLGCTDLKYPDFLNRIHPQWRDTIKASIAEAFRCFANLRASGAKGPYNYSNNVPIRDREGDYFWYQQRTFPVTFDARGNPVHVFAEFSKFCPFDNLVPSPAIIMVQNGIDYRCSKRILEVGGVAMAKTLKSLLTDSGYRNLMVYRRSCKVVNKKWTTPTSQEILSRLSMRQPALNKANTRVLGAAKVCFPASTLSSVADFAVFLNTTFGPPSQ